jgi:hypothetical protein
MIVGGIEEVRVDEPGRELFVADSYLGGRVMVFDLDTFAFKRGWGARGKRLADISTNDADHVYTPGGTPPKDYVGHLTLAFSNDGLVYAAIAARTDRRDDEGRQVPSRVHDLANDAVRPRGRGRCGVLGRQGAAVLDHLGHGEQPRLVPEPS